MFFIKVVAHLSVFFFIIMLNPTQQHNETCQIGASHPYSPREDREGWQNGRVQSICFWQRSLLNISTEKLWKENAASLAFIINCQSPCASLTWYKPSN